MHRSPMPRVLTTDAVAARERLAYWNDAVSDAYVRLDTTAPGGDVVGDIRVDALATLVLSRVTATAQLVRRTPSLIATAAEDFFLVSIQTRGTGLVTQDGRTAQLQPGGLRALRLHPALRAAVRRPLPAVRPHAPGP